LGPLPEGICDDVAFSFQLSAFSFQLSAFSFQLSALSFQTDSRELIAVSCAN
jgi:hypothetical protein